MKFLKNLILMIFTWWSGQTFGLRFAIWRKGEFVGEDELGNRYYRAPSAIPDSIAEHRWVVFNGYAEASAIPPGWHGWMHHRTDTPPTSADYRRHDWEKPHVPNPTGTAMAYRPSGSILRPVPATSGGKDYEPWKP